MNISLSKRIISCEKHGDFEVLLSSAAILRRPELHCQECRREHGEHERQRAEAEKKRTAETALRRAIERSGIPFRFHDKKLDNFEAKTEGQKRALDFAVKYASGFGEVYKNGTSAIFCGTPGTGKTHLACGIGFSVLAQGGDVIYTSALRAIRRIRDSWSRNGSETESQAVTAFTEPALLILDEIGVQYGSDAEKIILFDILNERYENRLPSLLISNLPLDGVRSFLGERIFDRLKEDGGEYIAFDWESRRGRA